MQCRGPIKLTYEICNKLSQAIPGTKAGWKQNLGNHEINHNVIPSNYIVCN